MTKQDLISLGFVPNNNNEEKLDLFVDYGKQTDGCHFYLEASVTKYCTDLNRLYIRKYVCYEGRNPQEFMQRILLKFGKCLTEQEVNIECNEELLVTMLEHFNIIKNDKKGNS